MARNFRTLIIRRSPVESDLMSHMTSHILTRRWVFWQRLYRRGWEGAELILSHGTIRVLVLEDCIPKNLNPNGLFSSRVHTVCLSSMIVILEDKWEARWLEVQIVCSVHYLFPRTIRKSIVVRASDAEISLRKLLKTNKVGKTYGIFLPWCKIWYFTECDGERVFEGVTSIVLYI